MKKPPDSWTAQVTKWRLSRRNGYVAAETIVTCYMQDKQK